MPLYRRLPKRGFSNAPFKVEYSVVNLGDLNAFSAGETVDLAMLKAAGLLPKNADRLKILAKGELGCALTVRAHRFSVGAKKAIEASGGKVEEVA